jgi:hypothetical protein
MTELVRQAGGASWATLQTDAGIRFAPIDPCARFSSTRLTTVLHQTVFGVPGEAADCAHHPLTWAGATMVCGGGRLRGQGYLSRATVRSERDPRPSAEVASRLGQPESRCEEEGRLSAWDEVPVREQVRTRRTRSASLDRAIRGVTLDFGFLPHEHTRYAAHL